MISYVPVTNAMIDPTSNIPLGSFQVAPLPAGQTTTYNNTPFTLTFDPTSFNGTSFQGYASSTIRRITVTGTLNGIGDRPVSIGRAGQQLAVSYGSPTNNGFQLTPGSSSTLNLLPGDQKLLVPSSAGGITTMEGEIITTGIQTRRPRAQHDRVVPQHGLRPWLEEICPSAPAEGPRLSRRGIPRRSDSGRVEQAPSSRRLPSSSFNDLIGTEPSAPLAGGFLLSRGSARGEAMARPGHHGLPAPRILISR